MERPRLPRPPHRPLEDREGGEVLDEAENCASRKMGGEEERENILAFRGRREAEILARGIVCFA